MILSVHIADVGPRLAWTILRARLDAYDVPGLRYAQATIAAPLGGGPVPRPQIGRVGLIAAWDDDAAFERFLTGHRLAQALADGWHVRLEPLRTSGRWSALPDLPGDEQPVDGHEPVAVLTLGRLRLRRATSFLRTSARAEREAVAHPGLLTATGLARPPRLVSTFSLWRTVEEMRAYAHGNGAAGHPRAIRANAEPAFHYESVFARFRPYSARGSWNGEEPLAKVLSDREPSTATTIP
jgi:hypothetical protein